jgi:uncharacterized protein (TIGR00369 family)
MQPLGEENRGLIDHFIIGAPLGRLLGLELLDAGVDEVHVRLPWRTEVTTVGDTVHGGAISALIDTAATAAF